MKQSSLRGILLGSLLALSLPFWLGCSSVDDIKKAADEIKGNVATAKTGMIANLNKQKDSLKALKKTQFKLMKVNKQIDKVKKNTKKINDISAKFKDKLGKGQAAYFLAESDYATAGEYAAHADCDYYSDAECSAFWDGCPTDTDQECVDYWRSFYSDDTADGTGTEVNDDYYYTCDPETDQACAVYWEDYYATESDASADYWYSCDTETDETCAAYWSNYYETGSADASADYWYTCDVETDEACAAYWTNYESDSSEDYWYTCDVETDEACLEYWSSYECAPEDQWWCGEDASAGEDYFDYDFSAYADEYAAEEADPPPWPDMDVTSDDGYEFIRVTSGSLEDSDFFGPDSILKVTVEQTWDLDSYYSDDYWSSDDYSEEDLYSDEYDDAYWDEAYGEDFDYETEEDSAAAWYLTQGDDEVDAATEEEDTALEDEETGEDDEEFAEATAEDEVFVEETSDDAFVYLEDITNQVTSFYVIPEYGTVESACYRGVQKECKVLEKYWEMFVFSAWDPIQGYPIGLEITYYDGTVEESSSSYTTTLDDEKQTYTETISGKTTYPVEEAPKLFVKFQEGEDTVQAEADASVDEYADFDYDEYMAELEAEAEGFIVTEEEYTSEFTDVIYLTGEKEGTEEFSGKEAYKLTYKNGDKVEEYYSYAVDKKGNYLTKIYPDKEMTKGSETETYVISADGNKVTGNFSIDEGETIDYKSVSDPEKGTEVMSMTFNNKDGEAYAELKVVIGPKGTGKGTFTIFKTDTDPEAEYGVEYSAEGDIVLIDKETGLPLDQAIEKADESDTAAENTATE